MRYAIRQIIELDAESFWDKLFFNAEFNRALHCEFLGFLAYESEDRRDADSGLVHRRVACSMAIEVPAIARPFFGDGRYSYTEVGCYDPAQRHYRVDVIPDKQPARVKTSCEMYVEPLAAKRCERVTLMDTTIDVFAIGSLLESALEKVTRDSYARAAEFTNRWILERGL